jgi:Asp-tRNA(Asn)/Glu-tRNA(Gln) amidotransferase B subunit
MIASNSSGGGEEEKSYLEALARDLIEALPEEADSVRNGQLKVMRRLIGEGMKRSGGKANARRLTTTLESLLGVATAVDEKQNR